MNLTRNKLKIEDTLDVFVVHGVGGVVFGAGSWAAQLELHPQGLPCIFRT